MIGIRQREKCQGCVVRWPSGRDCRHGRILCGAMTRGPCAFEKRVRSRDSRHVRFRQNTSKERCARHDSATTRSETWGRCENCFPTARQPEANSAPNDGIMPMPSMQRARKSTRPSIQTLSATTLPKQSSAHEANVNFADIPFRCQPWICEVLRRSMASSSSLGGRSEQSCVHKSFLSWEKGLPRPSGTDRSRRGATAGACRLDPAGCRRCCGRAWTIPRQTSARVFRLPCTGACA